MQSDLPSHARHTISSDLTKLGAVRVASLHLGNSLLLTCLHQLRGGFSSTGSAVLENPEDLEMLHCSVCSACSACFTAYIVSR